MASMTGFAAACKYLLKYDPEIAEQRLHKIQKFGAHVQISRRNVHSVFWLAHSVSIWVQVGVGVVFEPNLGSNTEKGGY